MKKFDEFVINFNNTFLLAYFHNNVDVPYAIHRPLHTRTYTLAVYAYLKPVEKKPTYADVCEKLNDIRDVLYAIKT